ncbi:MAG: hypothetical protein ACFFAN_13285, partial [Promethearchaeota archaeon]
MIKFEIEDIKLEEAEDGNLIIKLPDLTEKEKEIIDPIVAPTSGLRIQLYDILEKDKYLLTYRKLFLFLRMFKAISQKFKELKNNRNLKILIATDNRPSRKLLLKYCSQIFAYDGFEIYYQKDNPGESKLSSPYSAASVELYKDINLIIALTASHNDLSWNGIKLYIDFPIPLSGNLLEEISSIALNIKEICLKPNFKPLIIDAIQKNNDYVKKLLSNVLEIKSIKNKNIIIWPYLGKA